eukprot:3845205-Amphidinium_carterae.1
MSRTWSVTNASARQGHTPLNAKRAKWQQHFSRPFEQLATSFCTLHTRGSAGFLAVAGGRSA